MSNSLGKHISKAFDEVAKNFRSLFTYKAWDDDDFVDIPLSQLRPTQIAVGMKQVELKQEKLQKLARTPKKLKEFMMDRPIRVVLGPHNQAYIIDHHHLGLALVREGFTSAPVVVEKDYSKLSEKEFWAKMEEKKFVHPYDADGKKRAFSEIPKSLTQMQDDPYRALAGFARNEGAFTKDYTPFAEFAWADYYRARIPKADVLKDFDAAVKTARALSSHPDAAKLPGYIAPKKGDKPPKP